MAEGFDPKTGYNPDHVARSIKVEIDAPASIVWEILVDLPRYGEWNPFCVKCESTLEMGAPVVMTLANFWDDTLATVVEYVCAVEPEKLLAWHMDWSEEWPYAGRRDQYIESLGPERCTYRTTDAYLGESAIHIMRFGNGWIEAGFNATCRALKKHAEAMWAARKAKQAAE
jgi:hypothetical protein